MTAPLREAPLAGLPLPGGPAGSNLVSGTALSRLAAAFRAGRQDGPTDPDITFASSPSDTIGDRGVPNPYGRGLAAYEPGTVLFSDYEKAHAAVQQSKLEEQAAQQLLTADFTESGASGGPVSGVPHADLFNAAATKYGLPAGLLAAVARAESGFRDDARSPAGAQGLMQFMPGTASSLGVNPWDPASAIDGAARYLRQNLDRFGSIPLALAAYNAGPGNVSKYGGIPPFTETQKYVARVQDYMRSYGTTLSSQQVDYAGGGIAAADGRVQSMISAAMNLASRGVPYVWGGTSASGVDCSGLIFYAARAAGIEWKRYRAVDYGRMGTAVSITDARPGDIVYYDNPNTDTDHVGIYIGNGQMIQAPQSGDVVKVSKLGKFTSIRRIFSDASFAAGATPAGNTTPLYNGRPSAVGPLARRFLPPTFVPPSKPTITRTYDRRLLR